METLTKKLTVKKENLASVVGSGSLDVLATPAVAALMEGAAAELAQNVLDNDELTTVGTAISIETGQVIKPGKELKVTVAITNSKEPRTATLGSINLTTNDPTRPFRELRLQVDTK